MWRAIEDAAIFDEDEDDKDDNSEDDSISWHPWMHRLAASALRTRAGDKWWEDM